MLVSMKTMKFLSSILALLLLAGCATSFRPWLLSEIREGMDRAQVLKTLGEPDYLETDGDTERMHYTYRENYAPSPMMHDLDRPRSSFIPKDQQLERTLKKHHYVVVLAKGRVINYKELSD